MGVTSNWTNHQSVWPLVQKCIYGRYLKCHRLEWAGPELDLRERSVSVEISFLALCNQRDDWGEVFKSFTWIAPISIAGLQDKIKDTKGRRGAEHQNQIGSNKILLLKDLCTTDLWGGTHFVEKLDWNSSKWERSKSGRNPQNRKITNIWRWKTAKNPSMENIQKWNI